MYEHFFVYEINHYCKKSHYLLWSGEHPLQNVKYNAIIESSYVILSIMS